jgi:hypothetical protein
VDGILSPAFVPKISVSPGVSMFMAQAIRKSSTMPPSSRTKAAAKSSTPNFSAYSGWLL